MGFIVDPEEASIIRKQLSRGEHESALNDLSALAERDASAIHIQARVIALQAQHHELTSFQGMSMTREERTVALNNIVITALGLLRELQRRGNDSSTFASLAPSSPEAIYGDSHLRSVGWMRCGIQRADSVVRISVGGIMGTGFFVAPGLIVTNYHVLPTREAAQIAVIDLEHEADENGNCRQGPQYRLDHDSYRCDAGLDCATAKIIEDPTLPGVIKPSNLPVCTTPKPRKGENVSIIQHPEGKHKQIAVTANEVVHVDQIKILYATHTQPGSSGSPVFNDKWQVVALHRAGGTKIKSINGRSFYPNEGVLIGPVLNALGITA